MDVTKENLTHEATKYVIASEPETGCWFDDYDLGLMNDVAEIIEDDASTRLYTNAWNEDAGIEIAQITSDLVIAFLEMCQATGDMHTDWMGAGWYGNSLGTVHGNSSTPEWCEDRWDYLNLIAWTIEHNSNVNDEDDFNVAYFGDGKEPGDPEIAND
ncbi:MAG: hypothetical protein SO057_07330 [Atopobiaceae bacterium]|nr:hypothetical protein [Atopobiaceae bacterium]